MKGQLTEKETRNWKEGESEGGGQRKSRERNGGRGEKKSGLMLSSTAAVRHSPASW